MRAGQRVQKLLNTKAEKATALEIVIRNPVKTQQAEKA
jgi:hypothetical protein